jgi:L-amino acid N-acyltransferase YncA
LGQNSTPLNLSLREYFEEASRDVAQRLAHLGTVVEQMSAAAEARGELIEFCPLVDCRARQRYRAAVQDAVRVLDATRRSFKSRQLEDLRRMLEAVLVEDGLLGNAKVQPGSGLK